ncbi:MAG: hypothetical protein V8Q42_05240 [Anaerovoracaceae bacterium]
MKKLIELTDEIMFLENDDFSKEQIKNEIRLLDEYQQKYLNIPLSDIYDNVDLESCELKLGSGGYSVPRGYYSSDVSIHFH